jgi:Cu-Zn family superoxide dismutase
MTKKMIPILLISMISAAAQAADAPASIDADIHDATGATVGHVNAVQAKKGVSFIVTAKGLQPGLHGIHIHSVGRCDAPDFKTAGGHFAYPGQMHGFENPKGPHLGDIPNLNINADGTGYMKFHTDLVTLKSGDNSLLKAGGTSIIIHASQDDQKTDPSGNSGGRIACAVLSK